MYIQRVIMLFRSRFNTVVMGITSEHKGELILQWVHMHGEKNLYLWKRMVKM